MDGHCRVCMGSESLKDIFNKEQLPKDEPSLAEMLSDCVNAKISPDDHFSKKICSSCILDTQIAIRLKRRYEKNNQLIKVKQEILVNDEFINSLESEDWTLIERDPKVKMEQEQTKPNTEDYNQKAEQRNTRKSQRFLEKQSSTVSENTLEDNQHNDSSNIKQKTEIHQCKICSRTLNSNRALNLHMRFHKRETDRQRTKLNTNTEQRRRYQCLVCPKTFTTLTKLKVHSVVHTAGEYRCSLCENSYNTRSNLNAHHSAVHSEHLKHKCSYCKNLYSSPSELSAHIELLHTRPFKCPFCKKVFKMSSYLRIHIGFHNGERPFKCTLCSKAFTTRTNLKGHIAVHTKQLSQ